jgi:hypothetical protein
MTCIDDLQSTAKLSPTVHTVLSLNCRLCWAIEKFQAEEGTNALKRVSERQSKYSYHKRRSAKAGIRQITNGATGLDAAGGWSLVDEMWQEENPPHHLKLLPKRSCGEATIIASHAPTLFFHLCAGPVSGRIFCGLCDFATFLGAYKSVSSFWDRVPFSRRPSYDAGSSCLLHINLRSRPMSLSIDGSLTRIHNHVKTNAISATIFSMRPHLCNMITPTGICRRPGVSHELF